MADQQDQTPSLAPLSTERKTFWDAPARKAAVPGRAHSRIIRSMRLLLPLIAVGVVGLLMAWPRVEDTMAPIPDQAQKSGQATMGKNELLNPSFESEDSHQRPYHVKADRAVQNTQDPEVVMLDKPRGDMMINDNSTVSLEADSGKYRQKQERLLLQGNVKLLDAEGFSMTMDKLLVDVREQTAISDTPVWGSGPDGTLEATGLKAEGKAGTLIFTGPARLVLTPKDESAPASPAQETPPAIIFDGTAAQE